MNETKKPKTPGVIERIKIAGSFEEVRALVGDAMSRNKQNPAILTHINRAAVKRNTELSKP